MTPGALVGGGLIWVKHGARGKTRHIPPICTRDRMRHIPLSPLVSCQLPVSYQSVTSQLPVSYSSVTSQLLVSYQSVTRQLLVSYQSVTRQLPVSYSSVTSQFSLCTSSGHEVMMTTAVFPRRPVDKKK